jgi:hypothetical protein
VNPKRADGLIHRLNFFVVRRLPSYARRSSARWHLLGSQNDPARHFRKEKKSKWRQDRQLGISTKSVNHFDPLVYGSACPHAENEFVVLRCDIVQGATHAPHTGDCALQ